MAFALKAHEQNSLDNSNATGGSGPSVPSHWRSDAFAGGVNTPVDWAASPIFPDAFYLDMNYSNSSGSDAFYILWQEVNNGHLPVVQNQNVAMSVYHQLVAGTFTGGLRMTFEEWTAVPGAGHGA